MDKQQQQERDAQIAETHRLRYEAKWGVRERYITGRYARTEYDVIVPSERVEGAARVIIVEGLMDAALADYLVDLHNATVDQIEAVSS